MTLYVGLAATAVLVAMLARGELVRRTQAHDLVVSSYGIAARDARIAEQERLLRAVTAFEATARNPN